jgi:formate dehydrogenase subunit delta
MMSTDERLAYMADQILRNFAALGSEPAKAATADHIAHFWDRRMKARAFAMLDGDRPCFTPGAAAALRLLRAQSGPGGT